LASSSINQSYSLSMMRIEDIDDDKGHHEPPSRVQYDDYAMRDEELAKQLDAELNQRRRGRRAREETDSGRGKRPRSSINLRNVSTKYYGEDDESSSESDESSSSYDTSSSSSSSSSEQELSSKQDDEDSDSGSMDIGTE
jgi:hypothetical protein